MGLQIAWNTFVLLHSPRKHQKDPKVHFLYPKVLFFVLTIWKFQDFFVSLQCKRNTANTEKTASTPTLSSPHNAPIAFTSIYSRPPPVTLFSLFFTTIYNTRSLTYWYKSPPVVPTSRGRTMLNRRSWPAEGRCHKQISTPKGSSPRIFNVSSMNSE